MINPDVQAVAERIAAGIDAIFGVSTEQAAISTAERAVIDAAMWTYEHGRTETNWTKEFSACDALRKAREM